jgi:CubicO group peptidase (beta-lactamase class C family)
VRKEKICAAVLGLLISASICFAQAGGEKNDHQTQIDFSKLEEAVLAELKETNTPGAAVGVVKGDNLIFAKGFGVSNIETGAPVTPDMLFRLASVTKMFTAAALVTLVEKGKLKLDEPIGKYAKGLDARIAQLTANQLMSHTSGLKDEAAPFNRHDDSVLGENVRAIKADWLYTEPGRIFSYANPGYLVAGYAIEEVSGKSYADQMEESLFKPLGMKATTWRPTMAMTWPLSQGHDVLSGQAKVIRPMADNAGAWPAGFIFSSVADLSRFAIAFMNGGQIQGGQTLLPEVIKQLSTPHASIPGSEYQYGYGLRIGLLRGVRVFGHGGNGPGFGADIIMAPDHRVAVIILANKSSGHLPKSLEKAMELTLPLEAKVPEHSKTLPLSASDAERYVGRYGFTETIVEVLFNDGKLLFKQGGLSAPMSKISETRFTVAPAGSSPQEEIFFVMGADGNAEFFHGRLRSLKKLPSSIDQGSAQNERAEAQTGKAKSAIASKFVGTWKLVAIEGEQVPKRDWAGLLMYDATGHMAAQVIALDRPKFASRDRRQATQEETKAAFDGYAAYFGPYEVNEAEGVVIHHVKGSIFPNEVGGDNIRYYEFSGDRLTLILTTMVDGKLTPKSSAAARLIWERVK